MARHGRVALTDQWLNYACQITRRDPLKDLQTLHYASPEMLQGQELDVRADIYSIGILLFDLLSGSTPFQTDQPTRLRHMQLTLNAPKLPARFRQFQQIVNIALHKDRQSRYSSGQQMIAALDAIDDVTLVELDNRPVPSKVVVKEFKSKKTSLRQVAPSRVKVKKLPAKPRIRMVINNPAAELSPSLLVDEALDHQVEETETLLEINGDTEVTTPQEEPRLDESRLFEAINQNPSESEPENLPSPEKLSLSHLSRTAYIVLALLVIMLATWWGLPYLTGPDTTPVQEPSVAIQPPEPGLSRDEQIALWLSQAEDYMQQLRFTTPVDASAYPLFQQVLELDSGNQQALTGINRIVEFYRDQSLQKIADTDLLEARAMAVRGLNVSPGNEALLKIISDIDAAMNLE